MTVGLKKSTEKKPSESAKPPKTRWQRIRRPLFIALAIIIVWVVYAFGFQTTDVDLEEIQDETRQAQLIRLVRQIFSPDVVTYAREETALGAAILVPCTQDGPAIPPPDTSGPHIIVTPSCINPGQEVVVEGIGIVPRSRGIINLVPESDFDITIALGPFEADDNGNFTETVVMRDRPSENLQEIQAVARVEVGSWLNRVDVWEDDNGNGVVDEGEMKKSPRISDNAVLTWNAIIETVFLALLATTAGTILAVPLSFFASRNLMREIRIPLSTVGLATVAIPVGAIVGWRAAGLVGGFTDVFDSLPLGLAGVIAIPIAAIAAMRWAVPTQELEPPTRAQKAARAGVMLGALVLGIVWLYLVGQVAITVGDWINDNFGVLGFMGGFISTLGDILLQLMPFIAALAGVGYLVGMAGKLGRFLERRLDERAGQLFGAAMVGVAGALLAAILGLAVSWIYEIESRVSTLLVPAVIGGVIGLIIGYVSVKRRSVGVGLSVYYSARTVFNTLRSIEPLVMTIVFVVWVGIGPFAGALALAVHTTAALAKLYSEQVESIMPGPLEAVRATGASRMQTIVYAVVPQIVPPYISFTMYRWDINVRMSTIIGFAGGGGIGQLLQQNTQLGQYGRAATQMLAIAIVVASMDYISSRLRERFV